MKHPKRFNQRKIKKSNQTIVIEGPAQTESLKNYEFHEGLKAFRPSKKQFNAIIDISTFEEGRIIIARDGETIIGYATYLHPDPLERWSEIKMDDLLVLGAIEVADEYRGLGVGSTLLKVAMDDKQMENYIIITTEYYWHWDLKGTGLNVWEYRNVMEKMMAAGKLKPMATDDPEILSHPANCLLAYIGKRVPRDSINTFDQLRFMGRGNSWI